MEKEHGVTPLLKPNNLNVVITKNGSGIISSKNSSTEKIKDGSTNEVRFSGVDDDDDDSILSSRISLKDNSEISSKHYPDGGWGWMVVFSSLIISMIADGISFSFGLLYIEFLYEYGESKSATSWIGSLFMAVPLLTGPIMSALVDRYGCRLMTITGGLISGLGFILSYFADTIVVCYLTFGVIAGLGLGLCYVTAVVSIAFWFDKKRNLAIGLGACGTGVGTFVYAPMTQYFIEQYGWRGCVLLLAGTFLNMCVCGCLMRDPEWMIEENRLLKSKKSSTSSTSVSGRSLTSDFPDIEELKSMLQSGKNCEYLLQTLVTTTSPPNDLTSKNLHRSDISLPTFVKQNEKVPLEVLQQLSSNTKLYKVILENYPSLLSCRSTSDNRLNKLNENRETGPARVPVTVSVKLKKAGQNGTAPKEQKKKLPHQQSLPAETKEPLLPQKKMSLAATAAPKSSLQRTDSIGWLLKYLGGNTHDHFRNIKLHRNSVMHRGAMLNIQKYRLRASSCPDIYRNSMVTLPREDQNKWYHECLTVLKGLVDFSLFLEVHFLYFSLSTILLFTWFIVPYFYLAKFMTTCGYTEAEASVVISIIGITNALGMVGLGWAGDQSWTNVSKTYGLCLILCGVCTACMYFFVNYYYLLVTTCALFGLFFASSFSFTPMILADLVPINKFTMGYGLILLCQGIGNLVGPPIAGGLFDLTESWAQSFIQGGAWIMLSGVLILGISYTKNKKLFGSGPLAMDKYNDGGSSIA